MCTLCHSQHVIGRRRLNCCHSHVNKSNFFLLATIRCVWGLACVCVVARLFVWGREKGAVPCRDAETALLLHLSSQINMLGAQVYRAVMDSGWPPWCSAALARIRAAAFNSLSRARSRIRGGVWEPEGSESEEKVNFLLENVARGGGARIFAPLIDQRQQA